MVATSFLWPGDGGLIMNIGNVWPTTYPTIWVWPQGVGSFALFVDGNKGTITMMDYSNWSRAML